MSNGLQTAYVEVLYGCNLKCRYCYVGEELNHVNRTIPSAEELLQVLVSLQTAGVEEIVLLGGEPLSHPEIVQICRNVSNVGFKSRGVVTNGTICSDRVLDALEAQGFWIDITFRDSDMDAFDEVTRVKGSGLRAFQTAATISKRGIPLGIEFDCTSSNYLHLFDLMLHFREINVRPRHVLLHRILPAGDAAASPNSFKLSPYQYVEVFDQAMRIKTEFGVNVVFEDGYPLCLLPEKYWDFVVPCACAHSLVTVSPAGDVRYCSCAGTTSGNLLKTPLQVIWARELSEHRTSGALPSPCQSCDMVFRCRGGCQASSGDAQRFDEFSDSFKTIRIADSSRVSKRPARVFDQGVVVEK